MARDKPSSNEQSLATICEAAMRGDDAAFEVLHKRLSGGLRSLFVRRGCDKPEVLDDLVHRTWIAVWSAIREGRYDPSRSAISTFAYAIAGNLWLQQLRPRQSPGRLPDHEGVPELALFESHDPANFIRDCELLEAVRGCVSANNSPYALDDVEREIVEALGSGESERRVALRLGLAPSTINVRKRSALQKLRMCLSKKGFT